MSKSMLRFVPILPFALCLAQAQEVAGDWLGMLAMPSGDRRIALHISKANSGLKATLDSVEQGIAGFPLDSIKVVDSTLTFSSNAFQFSYEGKVDAAVTAIEGTFAGEAGSAPVTFRRGAVAKVEHKRAKPTDIDGDWSGTLNAAGLEQKYLFHITNTEDGLIVAMDFPAQYVKGAEASSVKRDDSSLALEWKAFGSRFEGKIAEDRSAIEGTVTQAGSTFPFTLKRTKP